MTVCVDVLNCSSQIQGSIEYGKYAKSWVVPSIPQTTLISCRAGIPPPCRTACKIRVNPFLVTDFLTHPTHYIHVSPLSPPWHPCDPCYFSKLFGE